MGIAWSIYVTAVDLLTNQQVSILPKKLLPLNNSVGRSGSQNGHVKIRLIVFV